MPGVKYVELRIAQKHWRRASFEFMRFKLRSVQIFIVLLQLDCIVTIGLYCYNWIVLLQLDYIVTIGLYCYNWIVLLQLDYIVTIGLYCYNWD